MRRSMTDAQRNVAALKMKREVLEPPRIDPKYFVSETDAYIRRHIGNTDAEEAQILKDLNLSSVE